MCLLNATALGTEVLKNLTLPGVGHFTIVDKQRVTGAVLLRHPALYHDTILPRGSMYVFVSAQRHS